MTFKAMEEVKIITRQNGGEFKESSLPANSIAEQIRPLLDNYEKSINSFFAELMKARREARIRALEEEGDGSN